MTIRLIFFSVIEVLQRVPSVESFIGKHLMYNPDILGFSGNAGPFLIPLKNAKKLYGRLPSSYKLLPPEKTVLWETDERDPGKVLNLDLGFNIKKWLDEDKQRNLKPFVSRFFSSWHRDYEKEFGISTGPLHNLNDTQSVGRVLAANKSTLEQLSHFDVQSLLLDNGILRRDTLNSIPPDKTIAKGLEAIARKQAGGGKSPALNDLWSRLKARQAYDRLPFLGTDAYPRQEFADELADLLGDISEHVNLTGTETLRLTSGQGIEFRYAQRDYSYLQLGKLFGDCTSPKRHLQVHCEVENIYWTVFSWIMDYNYQILLVLLDGKPVIKCHILPYFIAVPHQGPDAYACLFIDAIETVPQFRLDQSIEGGCLKEKLNLAFWTLLEEVKGIADRMGIRSVYSERFSNTEWVRQELERFPEIFLDTKRINKIDELEDVYCCATDFCAVQGYKSPDVIFMELQARNTCLISETIFGSNKSFAIIRGDAMVGLA